ncbi:apoptosis regulator Bcl-2-like [Xyrichtys novacula]|uniref:Apoptosis regulator Bcl-2-like n=1 Tax=Xyrichtys novacula TaxID=13765 RepID=A0AAV1H7M0_XYRNO|nr:apoptosis regulator Bcl-2-like [Xyrichtys novacula]
MSAAFDSRDMVEDFLRLRLQQDGLDWRAVLPLRRHHTAATSTLSSGLPWRSAQVNSPTDPTLAPPQLQVILRGACRDMDQRYHGDLEAHLSVLLRFDVRGLTTVREELFRDGVNWGRIVAMMEVGGAMCTEVVKTGGPWRVKDVTDWMKDGLDSLQGWIEDNGGWVSGAVPSFGSGNSLVRVFGSKFTKRQ